MTIKQIKALSEIAIKFHNTKREDANYEVLRERYYRLMDTLEKMYDYNQVQLLDHLLTTMYFFDTDLDQVISAFKCFGYEVVE